MFIIIIILLKYSWLSRPQGHRAARRVMSIKVSDTIGNRIRDLLAQCINPERHRMLPSALYSSRNISVSTRRRKFLLSSSGIEGQSSNHHTHTAASALTWVKQ